MQDINRLKLVLVEQKKTSKWLSEELGVNPSTVSKWCTNSSQPDIETLARISKLLGVGVEELFNKKFMDSVWDFNHFDIVREIYKNWSIINHKWNDGISRFK